MSEAALTAALHRMGYKDEMTNADLHPKFIGDAEEHIWTFRAVYVNWTGGDSDFKYQIVRNIFGRLNLGALTTVYSILTLLG